MSKRRKRPMPPTRARDAATPQQYAQPLAFDNLPSSPGPGVHGVEFQNPNLIRGPDGSAVSMPQGFALPPAATYTQIIQGASRVYSWKWDEALKNNRENALAMRRDARIQGLLEERKESVAQLPYHIQPEDAEDPRQVAEADDLTRQVKRIPDFYQLLWSLEDAVWYGRAGVQLRWDWQDFDGRRVLLPTAPYDGGLAHVPVNGDKIQYRYRLIDDTTDTLGRPIEDGTPCILGHAHQLTLIPGGTTVLTDRGRALLLNTPFWRQRFIIHRHMAVDADYMEGEMAGGIWGVGVRSVLYWIDWLRNEWLAWCSDFLERVGLGVTVIEFEAGNKQAEMNAYKAAEDLSRRTVVILPRVAGKDRAENTVVRIETPTAGAEFLLKMIQYLDDHEERYIVGQSMSGGRDNDGSLGGSGRAKFAQDTKAKKIKTDALRLGDTLTAQLLGVMRSWNNPRGPQYGAPPWKQSFVLDVDPPESKDKLEAAKTVVGMGVPVSAEQVRGLAGLSAPREGEETVGGQQQGTVGPNGEPQQPGGNGQPQQNGQGKPKMPWDKEEKPSGPKVPAPKAPTVRAPSGGKSFLRDDEPLHYEGDAEGAGHWMTIGGHPGPEGRHEGGMHIFVDEAGVIKKGPKHLVGHPVSHPGVKELGGAAPAAKLTGRAAKEGKDLATSPFVRKETLGKGKKGVNETFHVILGNDQEGIWKPESGERPNLRNSIEGGYHKREVAVSELAGLLGMGDLVPPTVHRPEEGGGSLQQFVPNAQPGKHFTLQDRFDGPEDMARAAAFDFLTLNTDRHAGNWMLARQKEGSWIKRLLSGWPQGGGKIVLIDNGLSFPNTHDTPEYAHSDLLHMAIKDDMPVPEEVRAWRGKAGEVTEALRKAGIGEMETDLTLERLDKLVAAAEAGQGFKEMFQDAGIRTVRPLDNLWGKKAQKIAEAKTGPPEPVPVPPDDSALEQFWED